MAENSRGSSFIVNEQMNQWQINIIANKSKKMMPLILQNNTFPGPQTCDTEDRTLW